MKNTYIILATLFILLTTSCRKEMPILNDPRLTSSVSIAEEFEQFWNLMNNNYVFWDIDTTDWDAVYKKYRPLFLELKNDKDGKKIAYEYYEEFTKGMIDAHMCITTNDGHQFVPSLIRNDELPNWHPSLQMWYFEKVMSNIYLDEGFMVGKNDDLSLITIAGTVDNDIAYLYLSDFALSFLDDNDPVLTTITEFLKSAGRKNTKGVILDIRSNGGGYILDMNVITANLISEKCLIGYTRGKGGVNRLDYTPWIPEYVTPSKSSLKLTVPIVVLADLYSASLSEITTAVIKNLPNGCFIGERTWGAQGSLTNIITANGGQFRTNTLDVQISSRVFKFADGNIYESIGLTPDIEVLHDQEKFAKGIDTQFERAVQFIKTGK